MNAKLVMKLQKIVLNAKMMEIALIVKIIMALMKMENVYNVN